MKRFLESIHNMSRAVVYAVYWTCVTTLLGAAGFLAAGYRYTGSDLIVTAFKVILLGGLICLGIEMNEYLKTRS